MKRFWPYLAWFALMAIASCFAQPLPPGAKSQTTKSFFVATPSTNGLFSIRVIPYTPQISMVEFYCKTNAPRMWALEISTNLVNWFEIESCRTTNDFRPMVPKLRDNARLVTWQLVKPSDEKAFYRIRLL